MLFLLRYVKSILPLSRCISARETSRERMYLEVWTDGTISPADAVSRSADLLVQQLTPFVNLAQAVSDPGREESCRCGYSG